MFMGVVSGRGSPGMTTTTQGGTGKVIDGTNKHALNSDRSADHFQPNAFRRRTLFL